MGKNYCSVLCALWFITGSLAALAGNDVELLKLLDQVPGTVHVTNEIIAAYALPALVHPDKIGGLEGVYTDVFSNLGEAYCFLLPRDLNGEVQNKTNYLCIGRPRGIGTFDQAKEVCAQMNQNKTEETVRLLSIDELLFLAKTAAGIGSSPDPASFGVRRENLAWPPLLGILELPPPSPELPRMGDLPRIEEVRSWGRSPGIRGVREMMEKLPRHIQELPPDLFPGLIKYNYWSNHKYVVSYPAVAYEFKKGNPLVRLSPVGRAYVGAKRLASRAKEFIARKMKPVQVDEYQVEEVACLQATNGSVSRQRPDWTVGHILCGATISW